MCGHMPHLWTTPAVFGGQRGQDREGEILLHSWSARKNTPGARDDWEAGRASLRDMAAEASSQPQDLVTYSDPHLQTAGLVKFSPCGAYVAHAAGFKLLLRRWTRCRLCSCTAALMRLRGSSGAATQSTFCVRFEAWYSSGLVALQQGMALQDRRRPCRPCAHSILTWRKACAGDSGLSLANLVSMRPIRVLHPIPQARGQRPRLCARWQRPRALAERTNDKDSVGIFDPRVGSIQQFSVASIDLEDLKWSPNSQVLAVIDTVLQYQVLLYASTGGRCLQTSSV